MAERLAAHQLEILGGFHAEDDPSLPPGTRSLLMIGPKEPGFWPHLQAQPEWDGAPDPIDRWSRRVIGQLACDIGAKALFPFGGPPYHPFYQWALRTGRVWDSPVRLLIHASQGLMVSFRGALAIKEVVGLPPPAAKPCDACPKACLAACPAGALGEGGYDVPACHAYLSGGDRDCMKSGCLVRRACPVSATYARMPEQSAYHMGQFHK
ncbi:MAG: ferredoxin [Pseudorhodobacter sp.]|nr:MAG: ferredoxin [Pseudorhodobacter sp.]